MVRKEPITVRFCPVYDGWQGESGAYGEYPSLDKLEDGDLVHTMDYRAIYSICSTWLNQKNNEWNDFSDKHLSSLILIWWLRIVN